MYYRVQLVPLYHRLDRYSYKQDDLQFTKGNLTLAATSERYSHLPIKVIQYKFDQIVSKTMVQIPNLVSIELLNKANLQETDSK